MLSDYKTAIGIIAVVISIIGYIPYFRDIIANKTKPHAFSWLVWGVLNAIAFAGQIHGNGGAGTWAVGLTAVALFAIFTLSIFKGEKNIKLFDWVCLGGAAVALLLWVVTDQLLLSIVLITVIDLLGFLPTVRKAYLKPYQETLVTYEINTLKYFLVVLALQNYSLLTTLFPLAVAIMNGLFVILLIVRRKQSKPMGALL
jgi:hypothetical protein